MSQPDDRKPEAPMVERREFLARLAFWTTAGAVAFAGVGVARMPKPGVMPGKLSDVKIGPAGSYPIADQPVRVPGQNLFLMHTAKGFSAISAICTHLGCIINPTPEGFLCPCHGSRFAGDGRVVQGPAGSPLTCYSLSLAADGQIVVHTDRPCPLGTWFALT